jgi:curved DNA binding protein
MSDESETEEVADLSSPEVTTKYRTAGDIANKALAVVVQACVEGADILTICELGDSIMIEETGKLYNKKVKDKKIEKGVAFPTCISVNEYVGHYSPMKGESSTLKDGDLVKIDMACHIDGFIAAVAHTILLGEKAEDRRADVAQAAWAAAEAALRLVQVGNTNTQVTEAFGKVSSEFECKPVAGVRSHQLKKHVIDGNRCIASVESTEEKSESFEFELNEVYCIDVVMSTGEGKAREAELRSTVFKRNVENSYLLKTQKARQFISEVNKRFPALPFTLRAIEDEHVARIGASEAKRHELLEEYPVLKEKDKEFVAQYKFTVLLLPGGTKRITGLPFPEGQLVSAHEIKDEGLKKLLSASANPKKKKNKSKKDQPKSDAKEDGAET